MEVATGFLGDDLSDRSRDACKPWVCRLVLAGQDRPSTFKVDHPPRVPHPTKLPLRSDNSPLRKAAMRSTRRLATRTACMCGRRETAALVKSLPFDLRRDELMMTLRPIPRKAIVEIVEGIVFSVAIKAAPSRRRPACGDCWPASLQSPLCRRRLFGAAVRACKSAGARGGGIPVPVSAGTLPARPGSSSCHQRIFGAGDRCVRAVLTSWTHLPDLGL
jgi:hypothetical protein